MTTPSKPPPISGLAVLVAVSAAVIAIAGVLVFYSRHGDVPHSESTPAARPTSSSPSALDKDGRFLWLLEARGLELSQTNDDAINDARQVCSRLERGESEEQIVQDIVEGSPELSVDDATAFAEISIGVYCP